MREGTAPCGIRYAVKRRPGAAAFAALAIQAGTRDECGFSGGIAHFTEHTLFRGTSRKSASVISNYLDRLGGDLNAYTTKEEIVLHATVLREDIGRAASLLVELATSPTFPAREIETERGVVIDEIIASEDAPADEIYDRFEAALFEGHPLGSLILGTRESVSAITSDELHHFVAALFRPSRMSLTLVADIPEDILERKLLKLVGKAFGVATSVISSEGDSRSREISSSRVFDLRIDRGDHEANAVVGATAPSLYGGRERYAAILLCNMLGGPASNSLLGSYLRERHGWVYGIECSYTQYADTGVAAISFGCDRPNLRKCLAAVDRILASVREKPISESRLRAAKKQLLCQAAISSESGETTCLSMAKSLLSYGRVITDEEARAAITSLTPDDILTAARTIFDPVRLSRLVFV